MGRVGNYQQSLPANAVFRDITRSDGSQNTWPNNTTRVVEGGQVNYMHHVEIDEGLAVKWRVAIGDALGKAFKWPEGPYVLSSWPSDYRMFIHKKGLQANPREDVYLFGSTKAAKFRSIAEFIPHAIWLCGDPNELCKCKYCSKRPQKEITSNMGQQGIIASSPAPSSSSPSRSLQKPRKPRPEGSGLRSVVYAAVQKRKEPSNSLVPKQAAPVEQINDLDAIHHENNYLELRRWYRNDELVWVELETPIVGTKRGDDIIKVWPAIVEDASTRSISTSVPLSTQNEGTISQNATASSQNDIYPDYDPNFPPWTISQYTKYKLRLLGTSCSLVARDDQVLPYQAYMPPKELIDELQDVPLANIRFDSEYTSTFTPVNSRSSNDPLTSTPTFEESTGPYALAIQIASQMSGFWGLTDDYDFKYTFRESPRNNKGLSLSEVISAAGNSNASNAEVPTSYGTSNISANRRMMAEELERTKAATFGAPKPVYHELSQKNFHGLWWGAERIWTGDMLRLKMARSAIAPDGGPHIVPASPAGPGTLLHQVVSGNKPDAQDAKLMGAGSRGVFMRLDALFMVEVDAGHGRKRNECRAAGPLYELADMDWPDPLDQEKHSTSKPAGVDGSASGIYVNGISNALSQPSSLKHVPLPNPNPAVPVDQTGPQVLSDVLLQSSASASASVNKSNGVFKPPIPVTHHELPQSPTGYKFRPILESGYEAVFSLTLLSGRYYPGILTHPLLSEAVTAAFTEDGSPDPHTAYLWPLEGLEPGFANSVDPIRYKKDRLKMVVDAEQSARQQLKEHLDSGEAVKPEEVEMEVDQLVSDRMQVDA